MPLAGLAAQAHPAGGPHTAKVTTHSTQGTVKSVGSTNLVIDTGKKAKEMTFALDSGTQRNGDITVGSKVEVRYTGAGATMKALSVQPITKQVAGKAAAH